MTERRWQPGETVVVRYHARIGLRTVPGALGSRDPKSRTPMERFKYANLYIRLSRALAVVVTLVYLARQIRQNTKSMNDGGRAPMQGC